MANLIKENTVNGNTLTFRANKIQNTMYDDSNSIQKPLLKKTCSNGNDTLTEKKNICTE